MRRAVLIAILIGGATPLHAAPPVCATVSDANLPPDLKAWTKDKTRVEAATSLSDAMPLIAVNAPATLMLRPAAQVRFVRAPEQTRTPADAHAGIFRVRIARSGTYRLSASTSPWIDVLRDGTVVASTAHGHLAPCTSVHKVVEFPFERGAYVIQISGNAGPRADFMVTPKP